MEEKKNTGLIVLVVILSLLIVGLGGYVIYDKVVSKNNNVPKDDVIEKDNTVDIKTNKDLDYVYDATYSYDNKYTEFKRNSSDDKVVEITYFGIPVSFREGNQYLSDLKVPYININSDYAKASNEKIKELYIEQAKQFDKCAIEAKENSISCSQILTYKTYTYDNILSVVVISANQTTSKWILDYNIYNIDLTSGNEIKYFDMTKKLGYDQNTLLDNEEKLLKNKMDSLYGNNIDLTNSCSGENKNCYEVANKMLESSINDGSILFFTNNDGNLNILTVPYFNGVQNGDVNKYLIEVTK